MDGWIRFRRLLEVDVSKRRFRFAREGVAYLVVTLFIGAVALLYGAPTLVMVFGMMCAPVLLSGAMAQLNIRRTRPKRFLPGHAFAGRQFTVEVALENRKRLFGSMAMVVQDSLSPSVRQFSPRVFFASVP